MNLIEIKAFLQENYEKDYFVYLKKQEKMILKFLELEVSGINPKKFLKTVYKVPNKSVSIFYRENFTGKTTFVELCGLAIHGDIHSTELPLDVKGNINETIIRFSFGEDKLTIKRSLSPRSEDIFLNDKRVNYEKAFPINKESLIFFIKSSFIFSQNDQKDVYSKINYNKNFPSPQIKYLENFIFQDELENLDFILNKLKKDILKDICRNESNIKDIESKLYQEINKPFNLLEIRKNEKKIMDYEINLTNFYKKRSELHIKEEKNNLDINNKNLLIESNKNTLKNLQNRKISSKSQNFLKDKLNLEKIYICPVCNQDLNINIDTENFDEFCPLCNQVWDLNKSNSEFVAEIEFETTVIENEIENLNKSNEVLNLEIEKLKQENSTIFFEDSKIIDEINSIKKKNDKYLIELKENIKTEQSEKEKKLNENLIFFQEQKSIIILKLKQIEEMDKFLINEIKNRQNFMMETYIKEYKNILTYFNDKLHSIGFKDFTPVISGLKANQLQIGSLRLLLSLTHLLTIQKLLNNKNANFGFPLIMDEPLRHLDKDTKLKFLKYMEKNEFNQIIFTIPVEIDDFHFNEFEKVEEVTKADKNKLDYFLNYI